MTINKNKTPLSVLVKGFLNVNNFISHIPLSGRNTPQDTDR